MQRVTVYLGGAIAAALVGLVAVSPAQARGVVIDGSGGESSWVHQDICAYGGATCSGIKLGFNIDAGSGLTDMVYVYDNGLVSIGAPLTALVNPVSSPSDLPGQNLFTPFVSTSDTSLMAASVPHSSPELDLVFGVQGAADVGVDDNISFAELELTPLSGGNPGAFSLAFRYDDDSDPQYPDLTRAVWGYQFGSLSEQDTVYDFEIDRSFDLGSPASGAPEPSTWAMLLLGLGGVGAMLRSRWATRRAAGLA
jgi:hypothetical protein